MARSAWRVEQDIRERVEKHIQPQVKKEIYKIDGLLIEYKEAVQKEALQCAVDRIARVISPPTGF